MRKTILLICLLLAGCVTPHPNKPSWNEISEETFQRARKEMPEAYARWAFSPPQEGDEEWEPPFAYTDFDYMERKDQLIILNYWNRTIDIRKEVEHDRLQSTWRLSSLWYIH